MLVHAGVCGLENPSVHETVCVNAVFLFWAWANTSMPQWQFRNLTDLTEIHNWSSYGAGAPASGEHCQPACGGQGCHGIFCNSFSWGNWGNRLSRLSRLTRRNERRRDIDIEWIEMFTHKKTTWHILTFKILVQLFVCCLWSFWMPAVPGNWEDAGRVGTYFIFFWYSLDCRQSLTSIPKSCLARIAAT